MRFRFRLLFSLVALATSPAALAQDAERAAHDDRSATPQLSFQVNTPDFVLRQYQLGCLSQLTYLIGSGGEAVVVDPQRDVDHYIRDADALGLKIAKVVLTHTNADFVAGHTELAARAGAEILISEKSGSEFRHHALKDGEKIAVGKATLELWATPGHTLDAMTVLVHAPGAAVRPAYALTGDTLFIGGIGRPDLVGGDITPMLLADRAFDSIERLKTLPDATVVLPAHGAGSLCGAHLSPDTTSTIGREKAENPYLKIPSRARFVSHVVSGLPVAPQYFKYNVALNRKGPPVVDWTQDLPPLFTAAAVKREVDGGAWVVDLRDGATYASGHIGGSVNVAVRGRLDTWTGIVVPFEARLVLVGSDDDVREAAFRFRRIGLDKVVGRLGGDGAAWRAGGLDVRTNQSLSPAELASLIRAGKEPIIVDVRTPEEFADVRVGDYANIPVTDWTEFGRVLDPARPVVMVCNSAYRSNMAVGLAERQGFTQVASLDGGIDAWITAGLPTLGAAAITAPPAAVAPGLPEPIEPDVLATALMDQPAGWTVIDVRPAWQYADYHVPGAENVAIGELGRRLAALPPGARVVIVDRDGTLAWAAAGAASRDAPGLSLRVLTGGTARFWRDVELGRATPAAPAPATTPATPSTTPAPAPRKRSAGC